MHKCKDVPVHGVMEIRIEHPRNLDRLMLLRHAQLIISRFNLGWSVRESMKRAGCSGSVKLKSWRLALVGHSKQIHSRDEDDEERARCGSVQ
jgi:hypothetical protein